MFWHDDHVRGRLFTGVDRRGIKKVCTGTLHAPQNLQKSMDSDCEGPNEKL